MRRNESNVYWKVKLITIAIWAAMERWNTWDKVFKNGPSKICGRHSLKDLKGNGLLKHISDHISSNFL